jgi:hypothetical protein
VSDSALQLYVRAFDGGQHCVRHEPLGGVCGFVRSFGAGAEGLAVRCGRGWLYAAGEGEGASGVLDRRGLIADVYLTREHTQTIIRS